MTSLVPFAILLITLLGAITWIDSRELLIPNWLNVALAATGMAFQLSVAPSFLPSSVFGAGAVYGCLLLVRRAHTSATGRIGLGLGDVKMMSASALWLNPLSLPLFVFAASALALLFVLSRKLASAPGGVEDRLPFGPFLSLALLLAWSSEHVINLLP